MRRAAMVFLIVFGCGLAAASLVALWTRATVLDTDRYVSTMAPIAESPAVQDAVSDKLGTRITDLVRIADAIPPTVDGRVALLSSEGFVTARKGIDLLESLTIVLPILALLLLAGHVLLSRPWRRGLLRAALRIAVVAAIVLAALSLLTGRPLRAAAARVARHPRAAWLAAHRSAVQWGVVLVGGLVLVAWDDPTAAVVLIDAALIALALTLVAALAHGGRRVAS